MHNHSLVYLLLRLAIAASMLSHGLVRLPKLAGFSQWMVSSFEKSMMPTFLVIPFSYTIAIAEFAIGILLLFGFLTRYAAIAGALAMVALLFGTGMIEQWDYMPSQLIHTLFFVLLLALLPYNTYSVDAWLKK